MQFRNSYFPSYRQPKNLRCVQNRIQRVAHVLHDKRTFHQRVIGHEIHVSLTQRRWQRQQHFKNQMRQKLRQLLIRQRLDLGLSQRALAEKLDVVHSFIGKVETGDRRLDVFEFVEYCHALNLNAADILQQLQTELDAE